MKAPDKVFFPNDINLLTRLSLVIKQKGDVCYIRKDAMLDWLKERRAEPHWKPSEEKMVALDAAISYLEESDNEDYEILNSLYEDLKKL